MAFPAIVRRAGVSGLMVPAIDDSHFGPYLANGFCVTKACDSGTCVASSCNPLISFTARVHPIHLAPMSPVSRDRSLYDRTMGSARRTFLDDGRSEGPSGRGVLAGCSVGGRDVALASSLGSVDGQDGIVTRRTKQRGCLNILFDCCTITLLPAVARTR